MFACSHTINAWYLLNNGNLAEARAAFAAVEVTCEAIPASHTWNNPMLLPWRFIDDGRAAAGLGQMEVARARADDARARFDKVIASRPVGSASHTRNRIGALIAEAGLFSTMGDWPTVEKLAADQPNDPDVLAALGFVAVFAAAANTPIACVAMGAELFGSSGIIYFGIAVFVAYAISGERGIYHAQRVLETKRGVPGSPSIGQSLREVAAGRSPSRLATLVSRRRGRRGG
jgi:hypothetical protein